MAKTTPILFVAALAVGGWFLLGRYEIKGWDQLRLIRRAGSEADTGELAGARAEGTIRVASFNIQAFGPSKAGKPFVMELLARIIRRFDVVAVQEIRSKSPDPLRRLLEEVNATGRHYDLVVGPREGRTTSKEQYVFFFDQATIEVDRSASYTIDDPDDLLHRPPFVSWFRVRGPPPDQAFTFSLVNIHTDPDEVADELRALDDAFLSVRDDGRGEDDVILLGDFNAADQRMGELGRMSGIQFAIVGTTTNTRRTQQYDNLVFQTPATREYVDRSGVFDFMREFNLTQEQALTVSDHLPVWAEFEIHEWGAAPAVAAAPQGTPAR